MSDTLNPLAIPRLVFSFICFFLLLLPVFGYVVQWIAVGVAPWDDDPVFRTRQDPPFWFNAFCALVGTIVLILSCAWTAHCLNKCGQERRLSTYTKLGIPELA